jgi:hypothetical protein
MSNTLDTKRLSSNMSTVDTLDKLGCVDFLCLQENNESHPLLKPIPSSLVDDALEIGFQVLIGHGKAAPLVEMRIELPHLHFLEILPCDLAAFHTQVEHPTESLAFLPGSSKALNSHSRSHAILVC